MNSITIKYWFTLNGCKMSIWAKAYDECKNFIKHDNVHHFSENYALKSNNNDENWLINCTFSINLLYLTITLLWKFYLKRNKTRLIWWILMMPKFDLDIKERHDVDNIVVDHLSKLSTKFIPQFFFLARRWMIEEE